MIQTRTIKKTGKEVSLLGLGAMRLPTRNGRIDKQKATKLVNYAIDHGVTLIDTAYLYHNGESETFLRNILQDRRNDVQISTKLPVWFVKKEEDLEEYLDKQMEKLGVEYIDYYFLHSLNYETYKRLKPLHVLEFLDRIKKEGKVKHVGFSYHDNYEDFTKIIDDYDWDMCLLQYNFIDEEVQAGRKGVQYAYNHDVSVFIMEPLKGGLLAHDVPEKVKITMENENIDETPSRWALKWLANQKEITCILSGMSEIEQLDENIETMNSTEPNSISEKELQVYNNVKKVYDELIQIPCTQCRYCMPCPAHVNIPTCFEAYNAKYIFKKNTQYTFRVSGIMGGKPGYASNCISCGACISKCPQKINIPLELKKVSDELEPFGLKTFMKLVNAVGKPIFKWYLNR
ncbi:aldo/keto reductase [uncultured Methanosphaera sp.]|uniref:aldo/keto reductase n=1 Tax=uncultured Methanosphaera sp. TaxID=262501 RepID=UPI000DC444FA|nr:aldo/keto reductase [uncultured Methanosphaera sp.]RAP43754.1 MAG: aldo/keto reductase [Methanosphaera sp. SHI1033]